MRAGASAVRAVGAAAAGRGSGHSSRLFAPPPVISCMPRHSRATAVLLDKVGAGSCAQCSCGQAPAGCGFGCMRQLGRGLNAAQTQQSSTRRQAALFAQPAAGVPAVFAVPAAACASCSTAPAAGTPRFEAPARSAACARQIYATRATPAGYTVEKNRPGAIS